MRTNDSRLCELFSPRSPVRGFLRAFPFELMPQPSWHIWWRHNWTLCFWISALYLATLPVAQRLMRRRPALHLRRPLLAWNLLVVTYSLLTGGRVASAILAHVRHDGFLASICDFGPLEHQKVLGTYLLVFALSKLVELGDTAFLVLRRKPVPFHHCFHHLLVLVGSWASMVYPSVVGAYFIVMNQAMHFLVYSNLTLKTLRFRQPPVVVPLLAALEMLQALAGLGLTLYASHAKRSGAVCCLYPETVTFINAAYAAFAVVFAKVTLDAVRRWRAARKEKGA